jgi:hypothetical protein
MILGIRISLERSMLIVEHSIHSLAKKYGKHPVSTNGGTESSASSKIGVPNIHLNLTENKTWYSFQHKISQKCDPPSHAAKTIKI